MTIQAPEMVLSATGIYKHFKGVRAVDGVDISVAPGELVGLIGPNGSGKSTLLACLSGAQPTDRGRIILSGTDITGFSATRISRQGVARTFQDVRVFSELTVEENVLLARNWAKVTPASYALPASADIRSRATELLDLTEMSHMRGTLAGSLSGGQKRLLEFVMALMPEPRVVMLDEAASGVNPTLVAKLRNYILQVRDRDGIAFVIVEHNVDFVFSTVDRIVVMAAGTVLAEGTPDRIRNHQEVIDAYLGA